MVWFARRFLIGAQTRFLLIGSTLRPNKFFPARQQCIPQSETSFLEESDRPGSIFNG